VSLYFPSLLKRYSERNRLVLFHFYRGYTGAGGLEKNGLYRNCTGGAARLVDVSLFGNDHIYQRPTPRAIYDTTLAFDPEGSCFFHSLHFCAYLDISSNDEESLFLNFFFYFLHFFSTFRSSWRANMCLVCLFGSRGRKSAFGIPSKQTENCTVDVMGLSNSK
jgi:hypothetical protein